MWVGYELNDRPQLAWLKAPLSYEPDKVHALSRLNRALAVGPPPKHARDQLPFPIRPVRRFYVLTSEPDVQTIMHIASVLTAFSAESESREAMGGFPNRLR